MNQDYNIAVEEIDIHSGNGQMKFSDACPHCGAARHTSHKFCAECGSALAESIWKQDNYTGYLPSIFLHSDLYKEMEEELKSSTGLAPSSYSAEENAQGFIVVTQYTKSDSVCVHCGHIYHYGKFCTKCGAKILVDKVLSRKLTHEEWREVAINAFYNKHPELRPPRPVQEQKYLFSVAVYRKWNGSVNFADSPFIFLSEQYTKDEIHGIADLNEEVLDGVDEATMLVESEVGAFFKDCIENRWLYEDFREEKIVEKTCSLGDKHEFLIIVSINKIN